MARDQAVRGEFVLKSFLQRRGPVAIIGLIFLAIGAAVPIFRPNLMADRSNLAFDLAMIAGGLIVLGVFVAFYLRRIVFVEADPGGLRWQRGGSEKMKEWSDVARVYRKETYRGGRADDAPEADRSGHTRVEFTDGTAVTFDRVLGNYERVADAVQAMATAAVRPRKAADLQAGAAAFGPVTLRQAGVRVEKKEYAWGAVNYGVVNGHLTVVPAKDDFKDRDIHQVPLHQIPDYAVLLELMEQVGKPVAPRPLLYPPAMRQYLDEMG